MWVVRFLVNGFVGTCVGLFEQEGILLVSLRLS